MSPDHLSARYPYYSEMVRDELIGWAPSTQLQPWYLLPGDQVFRADLRWPNHAEDRPLIVFARRQDTDDCACICDHGGGAYDVVLIQGWTSQGNGFEIVQRHPSLEDWYRSATDDCSSWKNPTD